ncbi:MAG: GGDEF domain-containing protein [Proteobacteria bacterium]|nr:GGDEF domain-containing protein [Pseudomonadota bacterium]MDA1021866.1 GGDEF domain-containing protein [Pseudomonadota bacterium]
MELVKNDGFQGGRLAQPAQIEVSLVSSVVGLTQVLEETLRGETSLKKISKTVGRALAQAQAAEQKIAEQKKRLAFLERLAVTDELTGLLNRRGFEQEIRRTMEGAKRYQEKGVLIFIDLDAFKPINDTHGHAAGDAVLRHLGELLLKNVRGTDSVGRLGGDEFAILLTRSTWGDGLKRAEFFDKLVNGTSITWNGEVVDVRASFGFQTYGPDDNLSQLLKTADEAMYISKRARAEEIQLLQANA